MSRSHYSPAYQPGRHVTLIPSGARRPFLFINCTRRRRRQKMRNVPSDVRSLREDRKFDARRNARKLCTHFANINAGDEMYRRNSETCTEESRSDSRLPFRSSNPIRLPSSPSDKSCKTSSLHCSSKVADNEGPPAVSQRKFWQMDLTDLGVSNKRLIKVNFTIHNFKYLFHLSLNPLLYGDLLHFQLAEEKYSFRG